MANVLDDGKPIIAIASLTPSRNANGKQQNGLPPVDQIAVELYTPLPGGLAVGGKFAPGGLKVTGLVEVP